MHTLTHILSRDPPPLIKQRKMKTKVYSKLQECQPYQASSTSILPNMGWGLPPKVLLNSPSPQTKQEKKKLVIRTQGAIYKNCLDECFDSQYVPLSCCVLLTFLHFVKFNRLHDIYQCFALNCGRPFQQHLPCEYLEYLLLSDSLSAICWKNLNSNIECKQQKYPMFHALLFKSILHSSRWYFDTFFKTISLTF